MVGWHVVFFLSSAFRYRRCLEPIDHKVTIWFKKNIKSKGQTSTGASSSYEQSLGTACGFSIRTINIQHRRVYLLSKQIFILRPQKRIIPSTRIPTKKMHRPYHHPINQNSTRKNPKKTKIQETFSQKKLPHGLSRFSCNKDFSTQQNGPPDGPPTWSSFLRI